MRSRKYRTRIGIQPSVFGIACMLGLLSLWASVASAMEPSTEQRVYSVSIDDKAAGTYDLTISTLDDGETRISAKADVKMTFYKIYNYKYVFSGREKWLNGQLQTLQSSSEDDGKKFQVAADFREDEKWITINDRRQVADPVTWTTTFWHLPADEKLENVFLLLDADTGEVMKAKADPPRLDTIELAGKSRSCFHVKITEPRVIQLWFDGKRRLVRQLSTEDGHPTELRLRSLRKLEADVTSDTKPAGE